MVNNNVLTYYVITDMLFDLLVEPSLIVLYRYKYSLELSFHLAKQMLGHFRSCI